MRAFKTALAVLICMLIANWAPMLSPFFMSLAAIITMQISTSDSLKMGRARVIGTAVGTIMGLIFALIQPDNMVLAALGVWILILIMNKLHWNTATQISTFVFLAIMVNMNGQDPFVYSASRFVDTFIGVVIGISVNYFVFPYNNFKVIQQKSKELIDLIEAHIVPHLERDLSQTKPQPLEELPHIRVKILDLRDELKLYKEEAQVKQIDRNDILPYEEQFELLWDMFEHMKHLNLLSEAIQKADQNDDWETDEGARVPLVELLIVYKYHLNQIEMDLEERKNIL